MRTYISIAIFASMTLLGVNSVEAQNNGRGPMGFSNFDKNQDNILTEKEFNEAKAERMKNNNGQHHRGMNISFADLDVNKDGKVTIKEFDDYRATMMRKHKGNRNQNRMGNRNMQNPKAMFAKMDANSDKFISEDELITFRQERMKAQAEKGGQMRNAGNAPSFESLDLNKDGKISESEFMSAHKKMMKKYKRNRQGRNNMMPAIPKFSELDKNGNGTVTEEEFIEFRQMRVKAQAEKGGQMKGLSNAPTFESIDKNKDGKIDKSEFENHMKNDCRRNHRR